MSPFVVPSLITTISAIVLLAILLKAFAYPENLTEDGEGYTFHEKGIPYIKKIAFASKLSYYFRRFINFVLEAKGIRPSFLTGYRIRKLTRNMSELPEKKVKVFIGKLKKSDGKSFEKDILEQIKQNPMDLSLHSKLANFYLEKKRYSEARDLYIYLAMHEPGRSGHFSRLGSIYYRLAQFEDAAKNYEISISLNSTKPSKFYNLGLCYNELGRFKDAINCFENALKMEPENEEYKEAIKSAYKKMNDKTTHIITGAEPVL
ncbi:MAG TPA: tetratricopeptide repeat protein [Patescibacteria group bacterium]|nr:tetratricopeptide repeat protein [Patescibacteria group bacterium]